MSSTEALLGGDGIIKRLGLSWGVTEAESQRFREMEIFQSLLKIGGTSKQLGYNYEGQSQFGSQKARELESQSNGVKESESLQSYFRLF